MALLLDTHAFIWYYNGDPALSQVAKDHIAQSRGAFFISMASFWEIAIKVSLGKLSLNGTLEELFQDVIIQNYQLLVDIPRFWARLSSGRPAGGGA